MITNTIEDFKENASGDISSAWFHLTNGKGAKHTVGFVSYPSPHVVIIGERKESGEPRTYPETYYRIFKPGTSGMVGFSEKIKGKYGGDIELSRSPPSLLNERCEIENSRIQMTPEGIAECVHGLGLKVVEINTHLKRPKPVY